MPDFCDHREIVATQLAEPVAVCADVDCSVEYPTGKSRQPSAEQDALTYGVGFTRVAPADVFRQPDTPTACPDCNNCGLPCLNEIHHPRQPDTSARDAAAEILGYHGCSSGDCPHEKQSECFAALVEAGYDAGHARALKEMGAKLDSAEEGERFYRREWESACERVDYAQEQLAAAQGRLDEVLSYMPKVPTEPYEKMLAREHREMSEQLAAAELRAGELIAAGDALVMADPLEWPRAYHQWQRAAHRRGGSR